LKIYMLLLKMEYCWTEIILALLWSLGAVC